MYHHEYPSPPELQDTIKCFWHNKRAAKGRSNFEVQPDGYAEIIFYFGSELRIVRDNDLQTLPSPFMMGLLNQPVTFYVEGAVEIIGVRCYPWTVFNLLGMPSVKEHVHTFKHPVAQLQPILSQHIKTGKIEEALAQVKQYFLDAQKDVTTNSLLFKAGVAMRKANGTIPVSQVANEAHTTVRTLERNFKQSSGHTVKDVSALIRFEQARNQLWWCPETNLAALAHELGYTDQSHLSREFKRYSGSTPAAFARKAKGSKPVSSTDFVAFIQV